jgi:23S rRNA pseudouridine2605 synthase
VPERLGPFPVGFVMERLNKYLAHAGLGSRRHCEELILAGRVSVDGRTVRELATRVGDEQAVAVDGAAVRAERPVYWLVNKPRGYLCTNHDPAGRPLAIDLVPHVHQRVYTVGRLDEDSEGLLLLTNDGELANRLMHPRYGVEKTYLVQVAGEPTHEEIERLLKGIWLSDGHVRARSVRRLKRQGESTWLKIVLSEGKNREIRRMLARLGHKVLRLRRVAIGPVELGRLAPGKSRPVSAMDLRQLKRLAERSSRPGGEEGEPEPVGQGSHARGEQFAVGRRRPGKSNRKNRHRQGARTE